MAERIEKKNESIEIVDWYLNDLLKAAKNVAVRENRRMTVYFLDMAMLDLIDGGYIRGE